MNKKAQFGFGLDQPKKKRLLTSADKKRIAATQKWRCAECNKPLPARYEIDHIKPFSKGGSDSDSNLHALCPNCHANKTEEDRHKHKIKKIKEAESNNNPFGFIGSVNPPKINLGLSSKRTKNSSFVLGPIDLGGSSKGKKKKSRNILEGLPD